jgi:uncharacterized membrane protein YdjX (TVP38/TMEM64 family)
VSEPETHPQMPAGSAWKPLILAVAVAALFTAALMLDFKPHIERLRQWIESMGILAPVAFIAVYVAATVALIPGSPLTIAAGGLFGPAAGTLYASTGATLGAAICFLISRYLAREVVARWIQRRPTFTKIDQLTQTHGGLIVALSRLTPLLPFNLLNYGFGVTGVGFWTYIVYSWLGMLPGTFVYAAGGSAIMQALREGRVPWMWLGIVLGGLLVLVTVAWYVKRRWIGDTDTEQTRAAAP